MFNWFSRPEYYVTPPHINPSPTVYWIGPTEDGRVSLGIGANSVIMNKQGVEHLIQLLSVARDSIEENDDEQPI
jgi:hypothetical protein